MVNTATLSWLGYGWEATYGSVSTGLDKAFGHGVRVTNLARRNNMESVFSCGERNAQKIVPKKYEGQMTVEWILANPWFFKGALGSVATTGAGPYTHTYSEADTIPSLSIPNNIYTPTPSVSTLLGATMSTIQISSAVNELVRVRADMPFANESFAASTTSKLTDAFDLFTFAHGTVQLPSGATLAKVQNVEVTLNNNSELIPGQGSRFAQEAAVKNRVHSGKITMAMQASADLLQKFYGGASGPGSTVAEAATMVLTFTNALTGTNTRSITMTYTGVQLDEDSIPQDPTQVIMEDVSLNMRSLSVAAINNTATAL